MKSEPWTHARTATKRFVHPLFNFLQFSLFFCKILIPTAEAEFNKGIWS